MIENVIVPRLTYESMAEIILMWDAWVFVGDDDLKREAEKATAEFLSSDEGARMNEHLTVDQPSDTVET